MKQKIMFLFTTSVLFFSCAVTAFAKEPANTGISDIFSTFTESPAAIIGSIPFVLCLILFLVFRKKMAHRLDNSSASLMTNMFILFFAINGILCLAMAFATDGQTWSNLMHINPSPAKRLAQFEDYINNLQAAGSQNFAKSAETNSPFSHLIYFILAQFLPNKHIFATSNLTYSLILKNQTFMYLYLILTMLIIVLLYRLNRSVLRNNKLNMRDELVSFLLVVSYPAIFCIEKGNNALFSLMLTMVFIVFHNYNNSKIREAAFIALAISAAITPYSIVFALLLLKEKTKKEISSIVRIVLYFLILFITPAIFTGFDNMVDYLKALTVIQTDEFIAGNMSLTNILFLFGISNSTVVYILTILTELIAILAIIILPATWQKAAAAVYFILNICAVSDAVTAIFVFIPLVLLLAENRHKAIDWLYLFAFALLITPFPEWYRFDSNNFFFFIETLNIYGIRNANNLIDLPAAQFILVLISIELIIVLKNKRKKSELAEQTI